MTNNDQNFLIKNEFSNVRVLIIKLFYPISQGRRSLANIQWYGIMNLSLIIILLLNKMV